MMRQRRMTRVLVAWSIFLIPVMAVITDPGTAHASTCNTIATGSWANNCTVSQGDDSDMVVGAQVAATLESPPCNTNINGTFDQSTVNEVMCFQKASNIREDGVVGMQTWTTMQGDLTWLGRIGDWSYWTNGPCNDASCADFRKWVPTGKWEVGTLGWEQMNTGVDSQ